MKPFNQFYLGDNFWQNWAYLCAGLNCITKSKKWIFLSMTITIFYYLLNVKWSFAKRPLFWNWNYLFWPRLEEKNTKQLFFTKLTVFCFGRSRIRQCYQLLPFLIFFGPFLVKLTFFRVKLAILEIVAFWIVCLFDFKHGLLDFKYGLFDFKHRLLDFET